MSHYLANPLARALSAAKNGPDIAILVMRHFFGDWGDVSDATKRRNNRAMKSKEDRVSRFRYIVDVWVATSSGDTVTSVIAMMSMDGQVGGPVLDAEGNIVFNDVSSLSN